MILTARGLRYTYPGSNREALGGLDFHVEQGEVFGFLGPNGSGKTTTQKLLTRILQSYDGDVSVFGRDLDEYDRSYFEHIGVSFEFPNLYEKLTAEENLDFYGAFFDGDTEDTRAVLERFDLPIGDKRSVGMWSKGMKMRLTLGRSLINRPRLWFLDEPTTGQDPQHAVMIRRIIRERAANGTSVFLTTHDMTVADELCDRVAFLVDGKIALVDSPKNLKLAHANRAVRVEKRAPAGIESVTFDLDDPAQRKSFVDVVQTDTEDVLTIHSQEPSLEDVFLRVTGRGLVG